VGWSAEENWAAEGCSAEDWPVVVNSVTAMGFSVPGCSAMAKREPAMWSLLPATSS
jgi:hypothetical protein